MTPSYFPNILSLLPIFTVLVRSEVAISGEAVTTRFWDCCKPSCSWNNKGPLTTPVASCDKDDKRIANVNAGSGCGEGGSAYTCSNQQPWAVNDTFSYGFAGVNIVGRVEDFWCCGCYQLDFTSEPLKNKSMIIQASNTAYDIKTDNRFSLAIPGGNTTSHDACARQFGVDQNVFGQTNTGVGSIDDCENLPEQLQAGCRWRYDWLLDASYPSANFKRVACPVELTKITGCSRTDDKELGSNATSSATTIKSPTSPSMVATLSIILLASLRWVYR
ncbi:glycoside hydrolase family 45 protein [Pleomassaria siparia CBS 279.74]|uniref:cellulase n=1 Tax=Pleomassaria siparia CBS 279.74 TaxID=1314801 RepID=A0A6G1KHL0_9PLEO|nr:glycoside hydrolase family 45 protein [Pleomassaria siparia CBS 279.74]